MQYAAWMAQMESAALFDLTHTAAAPLLAAHTYPWEVLEHIKDFIKALGAQLPADEYDNPREGVWIHKTAHVFDSAYLGDNVIVGAGTEVRHCAFVRGNALIGCDAVVGNSTELKNVILFDRVQVPHYNYVGDSVLGYRAHMGAGSITSNVKSDKQLVCLKCGEHRFETGLKKFGAMLGDNVEIGCGSVLNPGSVVGAEARVYPLSSVRGFVPARCIYKKQGEIAAIEERG